MIPKARCILGPVLPSFIHRGGLPSPVDYGVTILAAGAGFGKSQLIASWAQTLPVLGYGQCSRLGETPLSLLELLWVASQCPDRYQEDQPWQHQVDVLLEYLYQLPESLLILDDVHHLEALTSDVEGCRLLLSYLLDYRPPQCRLIFSGRQPPKLADLEVRQLRGEVSMIGADRLVLSATELEELVPGHGFKLLELTSGWPLAVMTLKRFPVEQWDAQSGALGDNLLKVATAALSPQAHQAITLLGLLDWASQVEVCDPALWEELQLLARRGVLVQKLDGERLRLHPLFAEQLKVQAEIEVRAQAIRGLFRAARPWEALELIQDDEELASHLLDYGEALLAAGRPQLLMSLLERASEHPLLLGLKGEVAWRLGDPSTALHHFHRAASLAQELGHRVWEAKAWTRAGELYLDAVCPHEADLYLRRAYRALGPGDRHDKAKILERFAENAVNHGRGRHAHRYRQLAARWDGDATEDLVVSARILMRSGRLAEARGGLEVAFERGLEVSPNDGSYEGHRDPRLVLAYLYVLEGRFESAQALAEKVLQQAREVKDVLTEAVAMTRLAHVQLLRRRSGEDVQGIVEHYVRAEALIRALGVERLRVEMLMGRALAYAWGTDPRRGFEVATEGVRLAQDSGDSWMQAWLGLVQAIAAANGQDPKASELFMKNREAFRVCRDRFGYALTELWLGQLQAVERDRWRKALEEFPFVVQRPSLFAPTVDPIASKALPPKRLQIFALGPLSILLDGRPVVAKAFKRKKARELLALLVSSPNTFVHREELAAALWPQADDKASLRDFRVALHALSDVLDPDRPKNTTAFCIDRDNDRYRLLGDKVTLDTEGFERLARVEATVEEWEKALRLYRGPFCEDYPFVESLALVRANYERIYFDLSERLAVTYLDRDQPDRVLELAQRMLSSDPTWEPAYRLLMKAQAMVGHNHLLPRTFTLCLETLENELGVEPSEETFQLARDLLGEQLTTLL